MICCYRKKLVLLLSALSLWVSCAETPPSENSNGSKPTVHSVSETFENPLGPGADPWMTEVKGRYYTCFSTGRGIGVTESRFITKPEKSQVVWNCPDQGWNAHNVWAPELHYVWGKWYIYYAAADRPGSPFFRQRTGVLEADSPFGPYKDKGMMITGDDPKNPESNIWAIDLNVFSWKKELYAVWSGWEKQMDTDQTAQHLYIARMKNPWTLMKRHLISRADQVWELGDAFGLQEGPEALIHGKNLYIIYSTRGSWTKDYRLGYLKLKPGKSPLSADAWEKSPGPVFLGTDTVHGVGHASFIHSPDKKEHWIYYHSKRSAKPGWDRDIRLQPFTFDNHGNPLFGAPVSPGPLKRPSGEVLREMRRVKER